MPPLFTALSALRRRHEDPLDTPAGAYAAFYQSWDAVNRAVSTHEESLENVIRTEVELEAQRDGESIGYHLVASATRR